MTKVSKILKVYFFSTTTFEVSESYQINKVNINRKLGRIVKKNGVNLNMDYSKNLVVGQKIARF